MEDPNMAMCNTLKNTENNIDEYPLVLQLKEFLFNNPNQKEFENWLNYTIYLLKSQDIPLYTFLHRISFINENEETSTTFFHKVQELQIPEANDFFREVRHVVNSNVLGPICFVTPEIGRWSTVGGLGVMVDELTQGIAKLGQDVMVISPYYDRNRYGDTGYLSKDTMGIHKIRNIEINLDGHYGFGVFYGKENGVDYYFLHNFSLFPTPYAGGSCSEVLRRVCCFCKAAMQLLCDLRYIPSVVVSNDWFTGLTPAYGKLHFGPTFKGTYFFHIVHNLDPLYEGRLYPSGGEGTCDHIHQINKDILVDPNGGQTVINPSRAAIMMCDNWGTVSNSYKNELLSFSPLAGLLREKPDPFAFPNGVFKQHRLNELLGKAGTNRVECKRHIQKTYFGYEDINPNVPIFSFVGRITKQKGVMLILEVAEELINRCKQQINILVGGCGNHGDPYFEQCVGKINDLRSKYPNSFWASPNEFFTDGPKVNLGSDFGLMPSEFEPGGIVQHEFFVAGTPVIAFCTGGLRDTVFEFDWNTDMGNGFTFDQHNREGLMNAMERALALFGNKEKYLKARRNAFNSVVDVVDVARAWCREFYKSKDKILFNVKEVLGGEDVVAPNDFFKLSEDQSELVDINVLIGTIDNQPKIANNQRYGSGLIAQGGGVNKTFFFSGECFEHRPGSISVTGSFDGWKNKIPMIFDEMKNYWYANVSVPKGRCYYKFIVDGEWRCNPKEGMETDLSGNTNNVCDV
jgi:starch synthase